MSVHDNQLILTDEGMELAFQLVVSKRVSPRHRSALGFMIDRRNSFDAGIEPISIRAWAEMYGISTNTAQSYITMARRLLRVRLGDKAFKKYPYPPKPPTMLDTGYSTPQAAAYITKIGVPVSRRQMQAWFLKIGPGLGWKMPRRLTDKKHSYYVWSGDDIVRFAKYISEYKTTHGWKDK